MASYLKTAQKFSTNDWYSNNLNVSAAAEKDREVATEISQDARYVRNETQNRTKWDQYDNNTRLSDRIDDVRRWRLILTKTQEYTEEEIRKLAASKETLEVAIEAINLPMEVNAENLVLRDGRRGGDLVDDEAEELLVREKSLLEESKRQLQTQVDNSNDIMCQLQEARQALIANIQDKNVTVDLDIDQYNLNEDSANISYKPNATRIPKGSVSLREWEEHNIADKQLAESVIATANQQREVNSHVVSRSKDDIQSQAEAVDFGLRKRANELRAALDELDWQKKQTEDEMADIEADIKRQEEAIKMKIKPDKLAQTRLENRTERPNKELCLDSPYYGLCDEVRQLEMTKKALEEKLYRLQHSWNSLEQKVERINKEMKSKTAALKIDMQCMEGRKKLGGRSREVVGGGRGRPYKSEGVGSFASSYKGVGKAMYQS